MRTARCAALSSTTAPLCTSARDAVHRLDAAQGAAYARRVTPRVYNSHILLDAAAAWHVVPRIDWPLPTRGSVRSAHDVTLSSDAALMDAQQHGTRCLASNGRRPQRGGVRSVPFGGGVRPAKMPGIAQRLHSWMRPQRSTGAMRRPTAAHKAAALPRLARQLHSCVQPPQGTSCHAPHLAASIIPGGIAKFLPGATSYRDWAY